MPFTITQLESSGGRDSNPSPMHSPLRLFVLILRLVIPPLWLDEEQNPSFPPEPPTESSSLMTNVGLVGAKCLETLDGQENSFSALAK